MRKGSITLLAAVLAVGAATIEAQDATPKAVEGTLTLDKKTYHLKHALAYETVIDNEAATAVVLSGQPVSSEKLKEAREAEKEGGDGDFTRPYLRLIFKKTGEIKHWSAAAGGTMIGRRSGTATDELKLQDGRAVGKAVVSGDPEGMFPSSFDVRFDTALVKAGESLPASTAKKGGPAANVQPSVTGMFKGSGKEAKLAHVSARWGEPFSGKAGIVLVFTEKDHSKDKKPEMNAMFGRLGSALIISLHEDGQIYGCQVVHSAHQKQGFSSIGRLEATDFSYANGKVAGELTTHGEADTFGDTWEVNLKFVAPLGEIPKELQPSEPKQPEKEKKAATPTPDDDDDDAVDDDDKPPTGAKGAELSVKDLALTKDASNVEYKMLVEQLVFKSKSDVKSVCAELAANLKAQGWTVDGKDMVQPQSSILRRKRGPAKLTIFVKPESGGSAVKIMTEGLDWDAQ
jgi:hypothetical protein